MLIFGSVFPWTNFFLPQFFFAIVAFFFPKNCIFALCTIFRCICVDKISAFDFVDYFEVNAVISGCVPQIIGVRQPLRPMENRLYCLRPIVIVFVAQRPGPVPEGDGGVLHPAGGDGDQAFARAFAVLLGGGGTHILQIQNPFFS